MPAEHIPDQETRERVKALAGFGLKQDQIAEVEDIDPKTLRKHYRAELDTGVANANAQVAQSLFRKAMGSGPGSVSAAIFWLKARAGWSEKVRLADADGNNLDGTESTFDPSKMSTEALAELQAALDVGDEADEE